MKIFHRTSRLSLFEIIAGGRALVEPGSSSDCFTRLPGIDVVLDLLAGLETIHDQIE